ncbi:hypothetical protein POJ06DRAFT_296113 [Lipomyces tetrasporus]|uniref:SWIM-type domain-containing protein n=1 Tax=Lipomyces tetrasporus TaxID=54092 RepID=A0AAD7QQE4_9ASCO|nr:uncharacterized protein POJ06DRAFT_296113 [Lipomyces tetrasporus]KAJ8099081.1 hypothetical protein POJ06DRAFT_296113 [Lipomyces tetrasporus]
MIKCHLLRHPLLQKVVNDGAEHPRALVYETYEEIHASSIREMLDYFGSRWEIASMCARCGSDAIIPISRTTMRLESHWRILKKNYVSRSLSREYGEGVHLPLIVQLSSNATKSTMIKEKWVCSCLSFIVNSRYLCKHLVSFYSLPHPDGNGRFVVRPPPPFRPELFQERLPLINFSDVQLTGSDAVISAGVDQNDSELESLQLLPMRSKYEETLGISRSVGKNTMRKAQKSYFHMRGQNQSRTPGNE